MQIDHLSKYTMVHVLITFNHHYVWQISDWCLDHSCKSIHSTVTICCHNDNDDDDANHEDDKSNPDVEMPPLLSTLLLQ